MLQEGLSNIAKHSDCNLVGLGFALGVSQLEMRLWDNGRGFDSQSWLQRRSVHKHFGLLAMRDRTELVGGRLFFTSVPREQTALTLTLPFSRLAVLSQERASEGAVP